MRTDESSESVVVTKSVRLVVPYVFTFGLFTMFHGAGSVGGGFQGGVIVAAAIITIAFGFGIDQTFDWLHRRLVGALAVGGLLAFGIVGIAPAFVGGTFFEFTAMPGSKGPLYAVELVEVGVAATVAATVVVLFFGTARGEGRA